MPYVEYLPRERTGADGRGRAGSVVHVGQPPGITDVSMTYDGKLIVVGTQRLAIVARDLSAVHATVHLGDDQLVSNSVSVDERNSIYVASVSRSVPGANGTMRKIVWTGQRLSQEPADGAWSADGDQPPAVKHGFGTGSTPTLIWRGRSCRGGRCRAQPARETS